MSGVEPRLAAYQLTREEAVEFGQQERWSAMTPMERGLFQLRQGRLCMPMPQFYEGMYELLGRPVYTHELADPDQLWQEYLGLVETPSFDAIIAKLPAHLRDNMIVVVARGGGRE